MDPEDFVTTPSGKQLPASPANRALARELWEEDSRLDRTGSRGSRDVKDAEDLRDHVQHLQEEREKFERKLKLERDQEREQQLERDQERENEERERDELIRALRQRDREREYELEHFKIKERVLIERETKLSELIAEFDKEKARFRGAGMRMPSPARGSPEIEPEDEFAMHDPVVGGLALAHHVVDPVLELAQVLKLETKFLCSKTNIGTVFEFVRHYVEKYPDVLKPFTLISQGADLSYALSSFSAAFSALKGPNACTLALINVIVLSLIDEGVAIKVKKAIKEAVSVNQTERIEAVRSSSLIEIAPELLELSIWDMPAIVQLREGDRDQMLSIWTSISAYVIFWTCKVDDKDTCVRQAKDAYMAFEGAAYTDATLFEAAEQRLVDVYHSWTGLQPLNLHDRIQFVTTKMPGIVASEYVNLVADSDQDETSMLWPDFIKLKNKAWRKAFKKEFKLSVLSPNSIKPHAKPSGCLPTQPTVLRPAAPPEDVKSEFQDIALVCKICGADFVFTAAEQTTHKRLQFANQPNKCKKCRPPKLCFNFAKTGTCPYGDRCEYLHDTDGLSPSAVNSSSVVDAPAPAQTEAERRTGVGGRTVRFDLRTKPPARLSLYKPHFLKEKEMDLSLS